MKPVKRGLPALMRTSLQAAALFTLPWATLSAAQSAPASGAAVPYTYAGLEYASQTLDDFDCTQDGLNAYGSLLVQDNLFVQGNYIDVSGDGCGSSTLSFGGGYYRGFNDTFDAYATLSFQSLSIDAGGDDSGLAAGLGLRGFLMPELETDLGVNYSNLGDGELSIAGRAAYFFAEDLAATLGLSTSADSTAFQLGVRMNF